MNLVTLASHTIDSDLLPAEPDVLDVGCRWFNFAADIFKLREHAVVFCMDPAHDVMPHAEVLEEFRGKGHFMSAALIGTGPRVQSFAHYSTGEGDFLTQRQWMPGWDIQPEWYDVPCMTIQEVMDCVKVPRFDLVKLDCEGSEFDILEHWPGPVATQISVEFHDWDKPQYRSETYYDHLFSKCLPWYKVVQHEFSKQGTGVGHWDSLLVLRK